MSELDIAIDTELRERALQAVNDFVRDHGTPVARAQMAGLLQVAANEPDLLDSFAGNQKTRAEKRLAGMNEGPRRTALVAEAAFWDLVRQMSKGKGAKVPWSLLQAREAAVPDERKVEKLPPGTALTKEQREQRLQKEKELKEWLLQWDLDRYAGFFRHFCAHYLYHLSFEKS